MKAFPDPTFDFSYLFGKHDWVDELLFKVQLTLIQSWVDQLRVKSMDEIANSMPLWFSDPKLLRSSVSKIRISFLSVCCSVFKQRINNNNIL